VAFIGIVCGYDLNGDLAAYCDGVARELTAQDCDHVIFSGGRTSPITWHSEAWTIAQAVRARIPQLRFSLEERSLTTLDNLVFSRALARQEATPADRYAVFCDLAHAAKVRILARLILGANVTVRALPRQVSLRIRLFEPLSIVAETIGAFIPGMQRLVRVGAVRLKRLTAEQRRSVLREAASSGAPPHPQPRTSGRAARPAPRAHPPTP
jgi:hypothetical protein